jgi:hypothetical protein
MRMSGKHGALPFLAALGCILAVGACSAQVTSASAAGQQPGSSGGTTAAAASSGSAPTSPATPTATPPSTLAVATVASCGSSQVQVTLTHTGAAAGTVGGFLTFTNHGSKPCKLTGWPQVTAITKAGKATKVAHASDTMIGGWTYATPVPVLVLAPGHSGYAVLESSDVAINATSCPPPYTRLKVTIPGGSAASALSAWLPGADAYLPSCLGANGSPVVRISDINSSSILPSQ